MKGNFIKKLATIMLIGVLSVGCLACTDQGESANNEVNAKPLEEIVDFVEDDSQEEVVEQTIEYDYEVMPEGTDEEEPELSIGTEDSDFDIWSK